MGVSQPSFEDMVAFVLGELDPARAEEVRASLAASAAASATLERIRRMLDAMRTDDSVAPRRAVVDRVKDLMPARAGAAWWARAVECVAALVFDSRAQTAVAGFRGGSIGRQLAFQCELGEIDLSVTDVADSIGKEWTIRGQMEAAKGPSARAVAVFAPASAEPAAEVEIDESGQFKLRCPLPVCELRFLVGDRVVGLGPVQLE